MDSKQKEQAILENMLDKIYGFYTSLSLLEKQKKKLENDQAFFEEYIKSLQEHEVKDKEEATGLLQETKSGLKSIVLEESKINTVLIKTRQGAESIENNFSNYRDALVAPDKDSFMAAYKKTKEKGNPQTGEQFSEILALCDVILREVQSTITKIDTLIEKIGQWKTRKNIDYDKKEDKELAHVADTEETEGLFDEEEMIIDRTASSKENEFGEEVEQHHSTSVGVSLDDLMKMGETQDEEVIRAKRTL